MRIFLNNTFILTLIILNAVIIFLSGFDFPPQLSFLLNLIDYLITLLFVVEMMVKIKYFRLRGYFSLSWNIFDFILILISIPSLLVIFTENSIDLSFVLAFRTLRVFKTLRFLKFVPQVNKLINGFQRALKASVLVVFLFFIYVFIIGIMSFSLFNNVSEDYFSTPLISLYSVFKIFTIEGWYEIPESITGGLQGGTFLVYLYFIFILFTGGILGLSLVNSIFVDTMVSDNNDELERKVDDLSKKIDLLLQQNPDKLQEL